jgi:hypothetical protein
LAIAARTQEKMRIALFIFLILIAAPAFAADFVIDPKQSQISFEAVVLKILQVELVLIQTTLKPAKHL